MLVKELISNSELQPDHWLANACVSDEDVVIINGIVHWRDGRWFFGCWRGGEWYSGTWLGGNWYNGVWWNGYWHYGHWYDGVWHNGVWKDGYWLGGEWKRGKVKYERIFKK